LILQHIKKLLFHSGIVQNISVALKKKRENKKNHLKNELTQNLLEDDFVIIGFCHKKLNK
jgi:ABC-type sulfate/molybdate transport systems ATPase subunit